MTRKLRKEMTRQAILKAAGLCFAGSGFRETQVADIAERAGVAAGTLYIHFASKEALLDELLAAYNNGLVERLRAAWEGRGLPVDLPAVVRESAEICLEYWSQGRGLLLAFAQRAVAEDAIAGLRDGINPPVVSFLTDRIAAMAGGDGANAVKIRLAVHGLLGLWTRIGMQHVFGAAESKADAVDLLVRMTLGAAAAVLPALGFSGR
ncbi:MAG: TetR/AcrR family transcriptional regulator [Candidatus Schekmanbacteria bacterium]|nr:TetR/AcrR family transcriptional regulator [Candidatus Schekmanbacteria bacterium]